MSIDWSKYEKCMYGWNEGDVDSPDDCNANRAALIEHCKRLEAELAARKKVAALIDGWWKSTEADLEKAKAENTKLIAGVKDAIFQRLRGACGELEAVRIGEDIIRALAETKE